MSRYKRRIIIASISIHVIALGGLFMYWLLNPDLGLPEEEQTVKAQNNQLAEGEVNEQSSPKEKIPDTGKDPKEDYEEGDLSNNQIKDLVTNSINNNLSKEEKVKQFNENFKALSRTPVKSVEKAADTVAKAMGAPEKSKNPLREADPLKGIHIDPNSVNLYDFEKDGEKFVLIYKDKNNVYIKGAPETWEEMDPAIRLRVNLIKKAKQNKKARILLDTTNTLLDLLNPREPAPNNDEVKN